VTRATATKLRNVKGRLAAASLPFTFLRHFRHVERDREVVPAGKVIDTEDRNDGEE